MPSWQSTYVSSVGKSSGPKGGAGHSVQKWGVGSLFRPIPTNRMGMVRFFAGSGLTMVRRVGAVLMMWTVLGCPVACLGDWHPCGASGVPASGCCPGEECQARLPAADHSHHAPADHCAGHGCLCAGGVAARPGMSAAVFRVPVAWFVGPQAAWLFSWGGPAGDTAPRGVLFLPVASGRDVRLVLGSLLI